jgi:tetratricopeptide (TPR) repeat protein
MLSLGFLATALEVSGQQKDSTFEAIALSNNLPDIVPQLPLPDLVPSHPPVTPPPPPPLPDIVPPVILPDVVPVPPASPAVAMALSQPDLVSDAGSNKKTALLQSIRDFGGKLCKLKKVKHEPKPVVVSSGDQDLMSQLYNTLERRRRDISGEAEEKNKPKRTMVKQTTILTTEETARKKAENLARAANIRAQNKKKWEEAARKNEEIARERRRAESEAVKDRIEQKARKRGKYRGGGVTEIDPVLHHHIVSELRSEIASLKEKLKNLGSNVAGTLVSATEEPIDTISIASSGSSTLSQKFTDSMIISLMDRVYTSGSESEAEEALEAYDKALALNPDFAEGYKKKGNSLYELGKYEEAEEALAVYEKALALHPDDAELSLDYEDDIEVLLPSSLKKEDSKKLDDMGSSDREG